ncbi:Signal peptidase complex catalytic subunit [Coccidioides posadasii str. Silveira]|uniref:Signal peptidase complex catalytic subunit SEC11 n=2 Tax=Coccidioides posadasii TaxID=199306 RepID=SEC11_COCPS|nr:RecName: Full=Signal peptidase complex catalytic subunit SEC11; AltName: Full=Signal peptidase I [Coccidioides posadasii str. Silveira]EFW20649.1 signal peptidase complex catalytic subunit SEC11 [Coccidioides posadasii str. Silveira]KMM72789.1 signal peptidase complex catalytic subunit SEC11 [Coccidioides posadasii RMSCC 3488]QVM08322.1 Signal peptidase complex catalytic subunit [Coccidioides posadasii str. Silveira]
MLAGLSPHLSNLRRSLTQVLNFALVLSTAFMMWKGLSIYTNSSSPIVVVLSGSMEPAFQRGDLLFLWNRSPRAEVGEIVVYNVRGKDIPIVHRVVRAFGDDEKSPKETNGQKKKKVMSSGKKDSIAAGALHSDSALVSHRILTKGDNNIADDTELYAQGQDYLDRKLDLVGSVRGYIPAVGYVTIMLSEHPWLKTVLLGIMGAMVILQRE